MHTVQTSREGGPCIPVLPDPVHDKAPAPVLRSGGLSCVRKRKDAKQRTVYRVGDVLDYQAQRRQQRARRRVGQQEA